MMKKPKQINKKMLSKNSWKHPLTPILYFKRKIGEKKSCQNAPISVSGRRLLWHCYRRSAKEKKKCNSLHITKEPFFRQQQAKEIVTKSPDFLLWCEKKTLVRFLCANPIGFLTYLTYFDRLKKGKFQIVVMYVLLKVRGFFVRDCIYA